jgi:hypothetical protein
MYRLAGGSVFETIQTIYSDHFQKQKDKPPRPCMASIQARLGPEKQPAARGVAASPSNDIKEPHRDTCLSDLVGTCGPPSATAGVGDRPGSARVAGGHDAAPAPAAAQRALTAQCSASSNTSSLARHSSWRTYDALLHEETGFPRSADMGAPVSTAAPKGRAARWHVLRLLAASVAVPTTVDCHGT